MNDQTAKILDKIQRTLALANDSGATEQERETALRMAHGLLAKHNLSMAQVTEHSREPEEERGVKTATFFGRPWAQQVCKSTADLFFCYYFVGPATKANDTRHYFVGKFSNASTAEYMAQYLVTSILKEARRVKRWSGSAAGRSFAVGAAHSLAARVAKMIADERNPATSSEPGTALVLASLYDRELEANKALVEAQFKLKPGKRNTSDIDPDAYRSGRAYGNTVSLNRQLSGSSDRKLLK